MIRGLAAIEILPLITPLPDLITLVKASMVLLISITPLVTFIKELPLESNDVISIIPELNLIAWGEADNIREPFIIPEETV